MVLIVLATLATIAVETLRFVPTSGDPRRTPPAPPAAVIADTAVIRAAEAAYFAISGFYAGEAELVRAGFLAQASSFHDVVIADGGDSYSIVCVLGQPCDQP